MRRRVCALVGLLVALGALLGACRGVPQPSQPVPPRVPTPPSAEPPPVLPTPTPVALPPVVAEPTPTPTLVPPPGPPLKYGGILRNAQADTPPSCDLRMEEGRAYAAVFACSPMLNQLVKYEGGGYEKVVPDLAQAWEVQDGGRTWVFRLGDARWHDGLPVTSADVLYSLEAVLHPPAGMRVGRAGALQRYIEQMDAPDPKTVVIRLKFPAPSFLPTLALVYASIFPRHHLMHLVPPSPKTPDLVVGSGPFTFRRWLPGSFVELARNPHYFLKDRPYVDGYTIYIMPDATSRLAALRTRQIDMLSADALRREDVAELLAHPRLREQIIVHTHYANSVATLQINTVAAHRDPRTGRVVDWGDLRLRQALNLAIDRHEVRTAVYGGLGALGGLLPPYSPWGLTEEEVARLPGMAPTGPAKEAERVQARRLLVEAGFPEGLDVPLLVRSAPTPLALASALQEQAKTIGVGVHLVALEGPRYWEALARREFVLLAHIHTLPLFDPDLVFASHALCGGPENYPGVCDPVLEDLFRRQQEEMDPARRREVVRAFQRRYQEVLGKMTLVWEVRHPAWWGYVKGYTPTPLYYLQHGSRMEEVWLDR
ncbi:MAG: ABC transporter substrate-binding protein [Dehalococcoidia bacterium]|nr:ABC transporter substrate-binding protein [Dehalococcoidia bacterium]MDW8120539.1 ABC transporter substrate-binding protein [Chloroflexota bacterium]